MRKKLLSPRLPVLLGLIVVACSTLHSNATASPAGSLTANGRSIFSTGKDLAGVQISARSHPLLRSCAACHRADGSGGIRLPGGAVSADLRYGALVTQQKHPYTLKLLERAVSTGIDNEGKPLSPVMPRWRLTPGDLKAVATYVYTKLR